MEKKRILRKKKKQTDRADPDAEDGDSTVVCKRCEEPRPARRGSMALAGWVSQQSVSYQAYRKLSAAERKANRWAVKMTSAVLGDIVAAGICVTPAPEISC